MKRTQVDLFRSESKMYFERNYGTADLRALPLHPHLEDLLSKVSLDLEGGSVLEIGCAAANNLHRLVDRFGMSRAVGTEPSPDVVDALAAAYPEMEFVVSDSRTLPFATGEFDLVIVRGVLSWIDREYLLQALGEVIRVAGGHLIVSDFSPTRPYSTTYHHQPDYRTFKQSYLPVMVASGLVSVVTVLVHDDSDQWSRFETGLYRKRPIDDAFPLRSEEQVRR